MAILTSLLSLYFIACIFATDKVSAVSQHTKLLVVSYDAFRYDYFYRNITPFINQLRANGTHTDYMKNIFVTKTFPNHHTMATGLFAETHGVVGNKVYDPITNKVEEDSYELYHYNKEVAPVWTFNEKASPDRHSGVMMWPGSQFRYLGIHTTFYQVYNESWPWETRVDRLISWFNHPTTPINLGVLYIEEPDTHGHALGINSNEFNNILKKLDNLTEYIYHELKKNGLSDVNVIHLSDHGMQTITKERIIDLNNFVNQSDYTIVESSPGLQIFPKPGKYKSVYRQLVEAAKTTGHFTVYKKEDIPDKYHFGKNPRIAPIFIVADIRYAFNDFNENIESYEKKYNFTATNETEFGVHGYDNEQPEMRPMFFAYGPIFKKQYKLDPFHNTDLFPLFCKILDLYCPPVNGTLKNVNSCLVTSFDLSSLELRLAIVGVVILLSIGIALVVFIVKRRRNRSSTDYRIIPTQSDGEYLHNENRGSNMA